MLRIAYRTKWQGELDHDTAEILTAPEHVAAALRDYDPCQALIGYPAGSVYEERQQRLMRDLRMRCDALVSELLAAEPEFAEVVE